MPNPDYHATPRRHRIEDNAPALLRALKGLVQYCASREKQDWTHSAMVAARLAIARAEGGE